MPARSDDPNLEWYSKDESVMWEHVFGLARLESKDESVMWEHVFGLARLEERLNGGKRASQK